MLLCRKLENVVCCFEVNHRAFYISQPEASETSDVPTNLKDFLMHFDSALAWRATYSDDEFQELTDKPSVF